MKGASLLGSQVSYRNQVRWVQICYQIFDPTSEFKVSDRFLIELSNIVIYLSYPLADLDQIWPQDTFDYGESNGHITDKFISSANIKNFLISSF